MDAVLSALPPALDRAGLPAVALESLYSERQFQYSQFKKIFAEEGESLKDTLCWEFGKAMASQYALTSPLSIGYLATAAGNAAAALSKILTDPAVGLVAG